MANRPPPGGREPLYYVASGPRRSQEPPAGRRPVRIAPAVTRAPPQPAGADAGAMRPPLETAVRTGEDGWWRGRGRRGMGRREGKGEERDGWWVVEREREEDKDGSSRGRWRGKRRGIGCVLCLLPGRDCGGLERINVLIIGHLKMTFLGSCNSKQMSHYRLKLSAVITILFTRNMML